MPARSCKQGRVRICARGTHRHFPQRNWHKGAGSIPSFWEKCTILKLDPVLCSFSCGPDSPDTPGRKQGTPEASGGESLGKPAHAPECSASSSKFLLKVGNMCTRAHKHSASFEATPTYPQSCDSPTFISGAAGLQPQPSRGPQVQVLTGLSSESCSQREQRRKLKQGLTHRAFTGAVPSV